MAFNVLSGLRAVTFPGSEALMRSFVSTSKEIVDSYVHSNPDDSECCFKVSGGYVTRGSQHVLYSSRFVVDQTDRRLIHVKDFVPVDGHDYFIKSDYRYLQEADFAVFPQVNVYSEFFTKDKSLADVLNGCDVRSTIILSSNPVLTRLRYPDFRVYHPSDYVCNRRETAETLVIMGYKRFVRPLVLYCAGFAGSTRTFLVPDGSPVFKEQKGWINCVESPVVGFEQVDQDEMQFSSDPSTVVHGEDELVGQNIKDVKINEEIEDPAGGKFEVDAKTDSDDEDLDLEAKAQFISVKMPNNSAASIVNNPNTLCSARAFLSTMATDKWKVRPPTIRYQMDGLRGIEYLDWVRRAGPLSHSGLLSHLPKPGFTSWFGERGNARILDTVYVRLQKSLHLEFVKDNVIGLAPIWVLNRMLPVEDTMKVDDVMLFLYLLSSYNDNPNLLPGPPSLMRYFLGLDKIIKSDRSRIKNSFGYDIHNHYSDGYGYQCYEGDQVTYFLTSSRFYPFNVFYGGLVYVREEINPGHEDRWHMYDAEEDAESSKWVNLP